MGTIEPARGVTILHSRHTHVHYGVIPVNTGRPPSFYAIPVKTGIQSMQTLGSRLRGNEQGKARECVVTLTLLHLHGHDNTVLQARPVAPG
jgi:hypothetical protein